MKLRHAVGAQIRHARTVRGWSQQRLADELAAVGVALDQTVVSRIESGQRALYLPEFLGFCVALSVSPLGLLAPDKGDLDVTPTFPLGVEDLIDWFRGDRLPEALERDDESQRTFDTVRPLPQWTADRRRLTPEIVDEVGRRMVEARPRLATLSADERQERLARTVEQVRAEREALSGEREGDHERLAEIVKWTYDVLERDQLGDRLRTAIESGEIAEEVGRTFEVDLDASPEGRALIEMVRNVTKEGESDRVDR